MATVSQNTAEQVHIVDDSGHTGSPAMGAAVADAVTRATRSDWTS